MRQKDQLKKDILKKRALLEKELQMEVNRELIAERKGNNSAIDSSVVSTTTASPSPAKPKVNRLATPVKQTAASRVPAKSMPRMNNENEAQNNASKTHLKATPVDSDSSAAEPTQSGNMSGTLNDIVARPLKDALTPANPGKRK